MNTCKENQFALHLKNAEQLEIKWVRIKSCQPDLHFLEQTNIAGGTTTLQLGTDVVDLYSNIINISTQLKGGGSTRNVGLLQKKVSLVDKV